ncbi:MAG: hypothetical protein BWK76_06095 [Desulfobulbaceae bacterium A2]|nr:MAG: hypothetical protein BWK76_06095 [Desulfobulbaceae bacterium A2]
MHDVSVPAVGTEKDFLARLALDLREFATVRDWERFHSPKNLAMALIVEAAELVEHFQWQDAAESLTLLPEQRQGVADEVADVLIYLVRLADRLDIDIPLAVQDKMRRNGIKYPPLSPAGSGSGE